MSKNLLMGGLLLAASTLVNAGTVTCAGKITQVNYHAPDGFMIQLDSMNAPVFFCKPNGTFTVPGTTYTTSAETCRVLVGLFTAAKLTDRTLTVMYFDGDSTPASCSTWGNWQSANIRYFLWAD
jgi:hypothetical protein